LADPALYWAVVIADQPVSLWPLSDPTLSGLPVFDEVVIPEPTAVVRDICGEAHGVFHGHSG
jgi:hypothetical protein